MHNDFKQQGDWHYVASNDWVDLELDIAVRRLVGSTDDYLGGECR